MGRAREVFEGNRCVQVKSDSPEWICLNVSPDLESKELVAKFFRSELSDLPDGYCEGLATAIEELLSNAIEHGCRLSPECGIELSLIRAGHSIVLHICDTGNGFALKEMKHAAINNPPDDPLRHMEYRSEKGMRAGGFGIMMVKEIADELVYSEAGNEVVLIKYLQGKNGRGS
ncbi:MAG: ATP-binding protein [Acidobacteriaceae bacterium]|nr:ATP-binding protein [Acidobacteriaceae bacterium]MBV9500481.1 ATP-binding protein [Acidobacteriaceae bacterium]